MNEFEKVEKLREKASVTYEEAKQALEANNWNILDAMVWLEKQGKVKGPEQFNYSTFQQNKEVYHGDVVGGAQDEGFGDTLGKFFSWCGKIIKKGMDNFLVIERHSDSPVSIPILAFILLLLVAFWVVIPLLIIGMFFGFQYSFRGPDIRSNAVNDALNKASKSAEDMFKEDRNNNK